MYGQPTIAGGRVFFGADTGYVYSLDAKSGCVAWGFQAAAGVRNAVSVGPISVDVSVQNSGIGRRLMEAVIDRGKEASEDDLKGYVRQNLARYKVPREIVFLDELPRNATGKVLKRELKDFEVEEKTASN